MKFKTYRVYTMRVWLLKNQVSSFIHNEVIGGRKWPELLREKDGTVPRFCSTCRGYCRAPRYYVYTRASDYSLSKFNLIRFSGSDAKAKAKGQCKYVLLGRVLLPDTSASVWKHQMWWEETWRVTWIPNVTDRSRSDEVTEQLIAKPGHGI